MHAAAASMQLKRTRGADKAVLTEAKLKALVAFLAK